MIKLEVQIEKNGERENSMPQWHKGQCRMSNIPVIKFPEGKKRQNRHKINLEKNKSKNFPCWKNNTYLRIIDAQEPQAR